MATNPFEFLTSASSRERRALLASTLGWTLDGMDVTLYAMVISVLLRELRLSTAQAGLLASLTLIGSGAGGILFGLLADRAGRRVTLMASITMYSLFTAACGLSSGVVELAAFRFLVGLGMGAEWGTGAALVSETWQPEHRAKALGLMQSGYAAGYALAAMVAALVMPRWGWRAVFFVGILPALLVLWIRRGVQESPLWLAQRAARIAAKPHATSNTALATRDSGFGKQELVAPTPTCPPLRKNPEPRNLRKESGLLSAIVSAPYLRLIALTLLINSAALFAWWGLFTWIPSYLALPAIQGGRGLSIVASSAWILVMQVGMCLGSITFGFVGDALGRRHAYIGYLLLAAALVPAYAHAHAATSLLAIGPLLAFFATGQFAGFAVITAELFPTSFRAFAMGLTYNFGRALGAAAPWAIGALAARQGLASAFWICAVSFVLAGLLALGVPETRGRSLA